MRRDWKRFQWPLVGLLAVGMFLLGFVGFSKFSASVGETRSFFDILYLDLQLFVLESGSVWGSVPWELQIARFLAQPHPPPHYSGKAQRLVGPLEFLPFILYQRS